MIKGYDAWKTRSPYDEPGYLDEPDIDEDDAPMEAELEAAGLTIEEIGDRILALWAKGIHTVRVNR